LIVAWKLPNDGPAFFAEYGIPAFAVIAHKDGFVSEFAVLAVRALGDHNLIIGSAGRELEEVYLMRRRFCVGMSEAIDLAKPEPAPSASGES
jgi:hypothetical protein